jgi:hypothetical protein
MKKFFMWDDDKFDNKENCTKDYKETSPCESCIYKEIKTESIYDAIYEDVLGYIDDDDDDASNSLTEDSDVHDDMFSDQDRILFEHFDHMESDSSPLYKEGEMDEDGITRKDNRITLDQIKQYEKNNVKKYVKCNKCDSTYFVTNPYEKSLCPSCENENDGITLTSEMIHPSLQTTPYTW